MQKKIEKYINSNNITWTRKTLLRLTHIKKKKYQDRNWLRETVTEYDPSLCTAKKAALKWLFQDIALRKIDNLT